MQVMEEFGTIVPLPKPRQFEIETDELVSWDLPSDLAMASMDEIEEELALGHPAWGSLVRVTG